MNPEKHKCEACEVTGAEVVESCDDPSQPYRLCCACHRRLVSRALRPIEWYNLTKRHGWTKFLLHDDFYDDDGTATQPEVDVVDAPARPAPRLSQVCGSGDSLLSFSITRWHFDSSLVEAWRALPREAILASISTRFSESRNSEVRCVCLKVAAVSLGDVGSEFVRYAWGEYPDIDLIALAEASAHCLPFREGFDRVTTALSSLNGKEKQDTKFALSYFRSAEALDWIEREIAPPITENWGYLAAASQLSWARVVAWLESGRPLSLVAIDALRAIAQPMTPFLREIKPGLENPPSLEVFREVVSEYMRRDPVPRVQQRGGDLVARGETLTKNRGESGSRR